MKGEWDVTNIYAPGSVVRKGGYLYEALVNILPVENVEPRDPDNDTSDKWKLACYRYCLERRMVRIPRYRRR